MARGGIVNIYFQVYLYKGFHFKTPIKTQRVDTSLDLRWHLLNTDSYLLASVRCRGPPHTPKVNRNSLGRPYASSPRPAPVWRGLRGIPNLFTSVSSLHNHAWFPYYLKLLFIITDFTFFSPTYINMAVNERVSSRKCLCTNTILHSQQQYDFEI